MTPSDFCVWLDGFLSFERSTKNLPNKEVEQIKEKLMEVKSNLAYQRTISLPFIPYRDDKSFLPINDNPPWNPGYNDFAKITCESGPGGSG